MLRFGFDHDARHDGNRFARILSAGGFAGEHDGVGAVEDGVGHVTGLGARGARVFDHRLEHLGGGDDGLAPGGGAANDVLLNDRNFLRRHFDAEIAAGDHDSVGHFENFFEVIDGLRLFEFGDDGDIALVRGDNLLDHADVGGGADEGQGDGIDAVLEAEFEILAIFFRERGDRESDAGKIDAFVLAEHAAVDDIAEHIFAAGTADTQFDQAIAQQDASARQ